jgi:pyruvate carboxylase
LLPLITKSNGSDDNTYIEADEAYVIGKRGQYTPVGAYLAGDEIIKIALQHDVNMIHPGEYRYLRKVHLLEGQH